MKGWTAQEEPKRTRELRKEADKENEVRHGIWAKDANAKLKPLPSLPKSKLAIRKPITKEQPKTFSEELHLVIWIV